MSAREIAVQRKRRPVGLALLLSVCGLQALSSGCRKPPLTDSGVVGCFGEVGLGWGDFSYPRAITASADKLFVADKSGRIQRFDLQGNFEVGWWMKEVTAGKPIGLTVHRDGRLFVADTHYGRVMIFDAQGVLLGSFGEPGDGPGQFRLVTDVAIDAQGYIYVGEYGGNDRISKFTPGGEFLDSFGEEPIGGARLSRPAGLAFDERGTLWVADACNHRIVSFARDGTVLGHFGEVGSGSGQMRWPYDINVCSDGSLVVSEFGNNRLQWFDRSGTSLRTWGQSGRRLGDLYSPWGVVEGPNGLIYVLDSLNNRVQIVRL